jgi:hypothetical protein
LKSSGLFLGRPEKKALLAETLHGALLHQRVPTEVKGRKLRQIFEVKVVDN